MQKFKTGQLVKAEEVQVQIVEKQKQIELQQQEILRKQRELEATVQKPADAERYRVETLANAQEVPARNRGRRRRVRDQGDGFAGADVVKATGLAEADANKARGLAEAVGHRGAGQGDRRGDAREGRERSSNTTRRRSSK